MNKGLTWKPGQTHVNRWTDDLLKRIQEGQIDPFFVITRTVSLGDGPGMYKTFRDKEAATAGLRVVVYHDHLYSLSVQFFCSYGIVGAWSSHHPHPKHHRQPPWPVNCAFP
jgi:hypothetical protein